MGGWVLIETIRVGEGEGSILPAVALSQYFSFACWRVLFMCYSLQIRLGKNGISLVSGIKALAEIDQKLAQNRDSFTTWHLRKPIFEIHKEYVDFLNSTWYCICCDIQLTPVSRSGSVSGRFYVRRLSG